MSEPIHADTLIKNAYIVTVDDDRRVFTHGYIAFRDGLITGIGAMADCKITTADETIDASGKLVLPGMGNAHNHLNQVFLRGYNDDRWPVLDFPKAIATVLAQMYQVTGRSDEERSYRLTRLHAMELTRAGYTATHDEHFTNTQKRSVDGSWAALRDSGLRGFLARCVVNTDRVPEESRETIDDGLKEIERLNAAFASSRIQVAAGIINYQYLDDPEDMRRLNEGSAAMGITLDVDMTDNSKGASLKQRGFNGGQVQYYESFGLLERPLYAGKAVNVRPQEFDILARYDCRLGLCPVLRQFDAVGLPLHHLLARGILPGIGTDAPMVTDSQGALEMMRHVIFGQNLAIQRERQDGLPLPEEHLWATGETVIEMATRGSARTLFMDDVSGSLEVGKAADCVIVDLNRPTMQPTFDNRRAIGIVVWAGTSEAIDTVFVEGRKLLEGGRSTVWDEETVIREAAETLTDIAAECDLPQLLPQRVPGQTYRGWQYF